MFCCLARLAILVILAQVLSKHFVIPNAKEHCQSIELSKHQLFPDNEHRNTIKNNPYDACLKYYVA